MELTNHKSLEAELDFSGQPDIIVVADPRDESIEDGTATENRAKERKEYVALDAPVAITSSGKFQVNQLMSEYFRKFQGAKDNPLRGQPLPIRDIIASTVISFIGILLVAVCHYHCLTLYFYTENTHIAVGMLTAPIAASAVLLFDLYQTPASQPRNLIVGHLLASVLGVAIRYFSTAVDLDMSVSCGLSACLATFCMRCAKCIHPPAGATALVAVMRNPAIDALGFYYVLTTVGAAFVLLCVATIFNNMCSWRQYPQHWT